MGFCGLSTHEALAQEEDSESAFTTFTETFDGYLRNSTAVRLDEPDHFININNRFELKYSNWLNDHFGLNIVSWFVYDGAFDIEDDFASEDEDDYRVYVDLREAVLDVTFANLDVHLGKQQVVWGKTDGFRVTDVVNPLDLRDTAITEFLDQRIPLWMANVEYYFSTDFSVQALIIPDLEFNEFPSPVFSENVSVCSTHVPEENIENTEYGLKLTGFYNGWDFTLNYLYSWDDMPVFKQSFDADTEAVTISPEYERLHIVGGTVANVFWDAVVRGEVAAKIGQYFSVDDPAVSDMAVEKDLLTYALACERDLLDIHWLVQVLQERILDYDEAMTTDEVSTYATLNGSKDFLQETLDIEMMVIYNAQSEQFTLEPSIEYALNDAIVFSAGVDVVVGKDSDTVDENTERIYAEVKYSF
jgi:hypothetical protein